MGKTRRWDPDYGYSSFKKTPRKTNPSKKPFYENDNGDPQDTKSNRFKNFDFEVYDD